MIKGAFVAFFAFALSLSSFALAQEAAKKEMKKDQLMETMKSVSCDPACGFSIRSHDEKEIVDIVKGHAKKHHNMDMTDEKVKEMMKEEKIERKMEKMDEKK